MGLIAEIDATAYVLDNACGNVHKSIMGKIASPSYPSSYPVNINCYWYIEASEGNTVGLTFESMDLEESDECNNDYVEVRDGTGNELGTLLGVYCGKNIPAVITGAKSMTIYFASNDDIVGEGFMATYYYG